MMAGGVERRYNAETGSNGKWRILVEVVLIAVCGSAVSACEVTDVDIYAGESWTEARGKGNDPNEPVFIGIGETAYFYAECSTDNPDNVDIKWEFDYDGGAYDYNDTTTYDVNYYDASREYDDSGAYTVTVKASLDGVADSDATNTCKVTVVKVTSLLPDIGTELDDGDGDPNTKSYVVSIVDANGDPNIVTVTAAPSPDVNEEDLPDSWSFTGGTDVNDFEHTVDRTTAAKTELTCTCGTSSKTTTIYVVKVDVDVGLSETEEVNPGKYINVNWDDDDDDGWEPNDTPPGGVYTGDKDDPNIDGVDNDIRSFPVSISPGDIKTDFPDTKVELTFQGQVKVWETRTKLDANGVSSGVSSGTQFKVEDLTKTLYLEGVSGSSEFADVNLIATYLPCDANDIIKVTVFEVDCSGLFGYDDQQNDNDIEFHTLKASSDKVGKISWDDANGNGDVNDPNDTDPNCEFFHNCMELQGTIKPSGVTTEVQFDITRKKWRRKWAGSLDGEEVTWSPFDPPPNSWEDDFTMPHPDLDKDLTPSDANHIYQSDPPGLNSKMRFPGVLDYFVQTMNFKQWIDVKIDGIWYQCSDYYKWHSQVYLRPKNETELTRHFWNRQKLNKGWITIPNEPNDP